uniref:sn-1-specific diacylglycerol lipase n=2 Tax=Spumella elongata TaxID=89044 RepID=A0A7S3H6I2_9STRA
MEDYEDPYSEDSRTLDALALCRSSLNQLQPVLRNAVGYAAGKVQQAGQALYQHSSTLTSRAISQKLANPALNASANTFPGDDSPASYGPSVGSLHHTILFLAQHLDSAALSKYVRTASGTVVTLRDIAVMHIARYVRSNVYLSSFVGVVHESTLFMVDRLRAGVELYSHILQGDDPEKMHLELLKDKPDWQHLLLRCSMASLTWKQRQLLEETRDGGSITNADFKRLVQAQILQFDRQRVAKIAKEYFYIPPVETKSSAGEEKLQNIRIGDAGDSYSNNKDTGAVNNGDNTVNTKALKSILSDTASIDMLYDYASTNTCNTNTSTNYANHSNNTIANNNGAGENSPPSSSSTKIDTTADASIDNDHSIDILKTNIHSWLVEEATLGDEDAQYALARFFTPPGFMESTCCAICDRTFSITLFRHHCRFCGRSVCDDHSTARRCIYRYGLVTPQRVCASCCENIDETHRMDGIIWRDLRVSAYLRNRLIPYFNPAVDRGIDKVFRVADYSMTVARNALTYNFLAKLALDTVEVLKRYGLTGFTGLMLREDFLESVELLKRISGMESMFSLSLHELTACVYYKLAIERGLRGSHPDSEKLAHASRRKKNNNINTNNNLSGTGSPRTTQSGMKSSTGASSFKQSQSVPEATPLPSSAAAGAGESEEEDYECKDAHNLDVQLAIRFAPLALNIIYEENPVDCQRLAKLQGWDTIFTNSESDLAPEQPCYTLFGASFPPDESTSSKTSTTNGNNNSNPNNKATGSEKTSKSTEPMKSQENATPQRPAVLEAVLVIRGTQTIQDVVTDIRAAPAHFPPPANEVEAALRGSSGAGGIDGNNGLTLHSESGDALSPDRNSNKNTKNNKNNTKDKWDWLAVPSHHTYACGGMVRSALYVLREVGPALRRLHAEGYQITIVGHSLGGAVAALMTYMLQSAVPNVNCITYGCPSCVDAATSDLLKERVLSVVLHDDVISRITPQSIRLLMRELMVFREQMFQHLHQEWVDVLRRASGLWTPRWRLALTAAPNSNNSKSGSAAGAVQATERLMAQARNAELPRAEAQAIGSAHTISVEAAASNVPTATLKNSATSAAGATGCDNAANHANKTEPLKAEGVAVMVDEEHLAQLWLPGRILHIYIHHGQCQAAEVSRNFPDLRTIILQGNIFEDHRSERILNALLEVRAVRQAPRAAPAWQSYHDSETCACCHNNFTWNSTFTGQAQEFRDKYNCRNCGRLVCDPCSTQRRAIPQLGHMFPKRICDQCLYKGDFASL